MMPIQDDKLSIKDRLSSVFLYAQNNPKVLIIIGAIIALAVAIAYLSTLSGPNNGDITSATPGSQIASVENAINGSDSASTFNSDITPATTNQTSSSSSTPTIIPSNVYIPNSTSPSGSSIGSIAGSLGQSSSSNTSSQSSPTRTVYYPHTSSVSSSPSTSTQSTNSTNSQTSLLTPNTSPVLTPSQQILYGPIAYLSSTPPSLTSSHNVSITISGSNVEQYRYRLDSSSYTGPYAVSQPITLTLSDGPHTISVVGGNSQGTWQSESTPSTVVWVIDSVPPTATILNTQTGSTQSDITINIGGSGVAYYKYALDNTAYGSEMSASQPILLTGLADGAHSVSVIGRDDAGNYQSQTGATKYAWTINQAAPSTSSFNLSTTDTSATFKWQNNVPTFGKVEVGLVDVDYIRSTSDTATSTAHNIAINNLQACTSFQYRITASAGGTPSTQTGTFITTGCPGSAQIISQTANFISYNIGGTLHLLNNSGRGISISIPSYFGNSNAQFQIKNLDKVAAASALGAPENLTYVGDYLYRLSALLDTSTLQSAFNKPITVSIAYSPADLGTTDESTLTIRRNDYGVWYKLAGCSVNKQAHVVTCTTDHFSDFALFGEGATSLTFVSDTIISSTPSVGTNHTIRYTQKGTVQAGETISFIFDPSTDKFSGFGNITLADISYTGANVVTACSNGAYDVTFVATSAQGHEGLQFTVCPGATVASGSKVLSISNNKISNPATIGAFRIAILSGSNGLDDEYAEAYVAIVEGVIITASVGTSLTFAVSGVPAGSANANDSGSTSITTTSNSIHWGNISPGVVKTARQDIAVSTNAKNGFVVTVQEDQDLTSTNGASIASFPGSNGSPASWSAPSAILGQRDTYGYFGITSDNERVAPEKSFGNALYIGVGKANAPTEVMVHTGPADGITEGIGVARIGYKLQVSPFQEAGTEYTNHIIYIVTPRF